MRISPWISGARAAPVMRTRPFMRPPASTSVRSNASASANATSFTSTTKSSGRVSGSAAGAAAQASVPPAVSVPAPSTRRSTTSPVRRPSGPRRADAGAASAHAPAPEPSVNSERRSAAPAVSVRVLAAADHAWPAAPQPRVARRVSPRARSTPTVTESMRRPMSTSVSARPVTSRRRPSAVRAPTRRNAADCTVEPS